MTVIRYVDRRTGERVPKGTPGARRVHTKTDTYYATIGRRRVSLETTDEAEAWARLRQRQHGQAGQRDPVTEQQRRPLAEHLREWLQSVEDATSAQRARQLRYRWNWLLQKTGWLWLTDITADSLLAALAKLRKPTARYPQGRGPQTRNQYLFHAQQFVGWCCRPPRRLQEDVLRGLRAQPSEGHERHARRCPTDEEIAALMAANLTDRYGMTGPQRQLGYRLAMATGLRASELRSLTRASFDLDRGEVTLTGAYSKNRRTDVMALPPWLVDELRQWFAGGGGVWSGFPAWFPGRPLKTDLAAAGVAWSLPGPDGRPEFFDFHALRHWYCTWAANLPGISPKTLLTLSRHSNPTLTLKRYAKARRQDVAAAVGQLPEPKKKSG